jgi:RecB family exonuclease
MATERLRVPYGEAAFAALRTAISRVQGGDPLAAVTVLVHSNAVGVAARRWLAANGGIAAAQFLTPFRFAELLGGPVLAAGHRRPLSTPVIDVAVRRVLELSAGMLQPIAQHQATIAALTEAHRELRHLPPATVQRLRNEGSRRAREVVRVHLEVQDALRTDWYDEADLLRAACTNTAQAPAATVVFLPQRTRPTEEALLSALADHGELVVIEGDAAPPSGVPMEIVDASDADEEAREAVRVVVGAIHQGTPLHRIGVVWPRHEPYARLVGEHLDEAAVPWNGRPGIALHERVAARIVLDLLRLDRRGIRRADLFALLAHVPARTADGHLVSRQRWERLSRDAGLAGDADWSGRLTRFRDRLAANGRDYDAAAATALQEFVADLRAEIGERDSVQDWQHWSKVCHRMLQRWLGGNRGIASLPADELDAHGSVQAALDRLSRLDALAGPCTREVFAQTLEAELTSAPGRVGRIGVGVQIGPLSFAVAQPLDLIVVVGACEGLLPAPPPPEALLGDADRALTGGALPVNADLVTEQQHQLWAALAGAKRAVVLSPRGDLRATASRQPSRWLEELARGALPARSVPSFAAGLADAAFPATITQHRVRALTHYACAGQAVAQHPLVSAVEALRLGAAMVEARESAAFTEYDGDLGGLPVDPLGSDPVSPTRLEQWTECPHAWFMKFMLGVEPVEQPDEQMEITPRDRGTMVHAALDEFHRRVVAGELPQPGASGWTEAHRAALLDAFEDVAAAMEQQGLTGRTAFWRAEQVRQRHELTTWLNRDGARVAERRATVLATEHRFGMGGAPPAAIALPGGGEVLLRGSVDRIDRCLDGRLVVTDHKTGTANPYRDITDVDPTAGGSKLQLPAYAAAALALTGAPPATEVIAEYGFLLRGGFKRVTVTVGPNNWPQVGAVLEHILAGIRSGLFVALPEKSQFRRSIAACPWCDPENLGTAELWRQFDRKRADPRVAALLGEAAGETSEGAGDV